MSTNKILTDGIDKNDAGYPEYKKLCDKEFPRTQSEVLQDFIEHFKTLETASTGMTSDFSDGYYTGVKAGISAIKLFFPAEYAKYDAANKQPVIIEFVSDPVERRFIDAEKNYLYYLTSPANFILLYSNTINPFQRLALIELAEEKGFSDLAKKFREAMK